jgi:hypothetical protein
VTACIIFKLPVHQSVCTCLLQCVRFAAFEIYLFKDCIESLLYYFRNNDGNYVNSIIPSNIKQIIITLITNFNRLRDICQGSDKNSLREKFEFPATEAP